MAKKAPKKVPTKTAKDAKPAAPAKRPAGKVVGRMGSELPKDANKPARIVLLDSHAILHRAYHALPDFSKANGEPTGALYGLILMLLKINESLKPDYIIATRDLPGKTVRHETFEAYKATRAQIDDALIKQLIQAPDIFNAFGIPVYEKPGYEADDMLGTIAKETSKRSDIETIIATGDSDTLQLVGPRTKVFMIRTGISDTVIYDIEEVKAKYGFGPEYVIDYKGIVGDTSDNIPGVPGVGAGSASKLIATYGGLAKIYEALQKKGVEAVSKESGVRKQYVELVAANQSQAKFSKDLATIHTDLPIGFSLPAQHYHMKEFADTIGPMLEAYEFHSIRQRLKTALGLGEPTTQSFGETDVVVGADAVKELGVAMWLLKSDVTSPTVQDILSFAKTQNFDEAKKVILEQLRDTGRLELVFKEIEQPLIAVVNRMNAEGIMLDVKYMASLEREYASELSKIGLRIFGYAGHEFNINSPKQLGDVLYDELKITPERQKKTATGARTTKEEELLKMADQHPIIMDVLSYRELQKLLGTYIEKMPKLVGNDGRLRTEFVQNGSATGRMSCQDPNLQNIPIKTENGRRIRTGFIAPKGKKLVAIDYSQIELRIAAGLSGDEILTDVFRRGEDVHAATAAQVFGVPPEMVDKEMRRRAKVINFGILYGMGVNALRQNLGEGVTRDEAATFLAEYFKNFAGVARYIEKTKADAQRQGYTETLYGRRRYFPGFQSPLPNIKAQAERMAINAPIQGTQADIIKRAMVVADEMIEQKGWRDRAKLLLQVHDELVYEIDEKDVAEIGEALRSVMESVVDPELLSGVPIIAEMSVGTNWGNVERIKHS